eukprot:scaffold55982_cov54-Phaeocystis_antarctica.AAC.4
MATTGAAKRCMVSEAVSAVGAGEDSQGRGRAAHPQRHGGQGPALRRRHGGRGRASGEAYTARIASCSRRSKGAARPRRTLPLAAAAASTTENER